MENNRTEILRELEAELAALKEKVQALEDKLEAFRQLPPEPAPAEAPVEESDFTDMEIGVPDLSAEPAPEPIPEPVEEPAEEPVEMDLPEPEPEPEPVPELVEEPAEEPVEEAIEMDLPAPEPVPTPVPDPVEKPVEEPVVAPVEEPKPAPVPLEGTERLPWRLDKPGLPVKHIRSGISMYDRALFIGTLFKEDYALYDRTIGDLDALTGLDEAVDYLTERFPDWNLKSDIVYNFIMAIRKKLG